MSVPVLGTIDLVVDVIWSLTTASHWDNGFNFQSIIPLYSQSIFMNKVGTDIPISWRRKLRTSWPIVLGPEADLEGWCSFCPNAEILESSFVIKD